MKDKKTIAHHGFSGVGLRRRTDNDQTGIDLAKTGTTVTTLIAHSVIAGEDEHPRIVLHAC